MSTTNQLPIEVIISRARIVLKRFKKLPDLLKEKGIEHILPADYDTMREGGYLSILSIKSDSNNLYQIGKILNIPDQEYGSKSEKYLLFAKRKCLALFNENSALVSTQTTFKVAGGLRISADNIVAFSGRTPQEDEALVVILAYKCVWISFDELREIQSVVQNPYLEERMLDLLLQE